MATRISGSYLIKRILISLLVIWGILTVLFFLLKGIPGDFTTTLLNPNLEPEALRQLRQRFGIGEPLWKQYIKWLRNYLLLDFGYSLSGTEKVSTIIFRRLPRTLVLFGTAYLLQFTIGMITGINFGWKRGSVSDRGGFSTGLTLYSLPFFWLAWILLLLFAYEGSYGIAWFPARYMLPTEAKFDTLGMLFGVLKHLFLPVVSLVIVGWAGTMLVMRTSMQEVLGEEYIQTARAKGLSPMTVKYKHASRNALIPVATQAIVSVAFLIDGSVIVETVFSWPGLGSLLVNSIFTRNFPVALAAFFMLGVIIVVARLVTDIVYTFLDPRIKFGEKQ
jgi:peptide/nickel transport system permease protein